MNLSHSSLRRLLSHPLNREMGVLLLLLLSIPAGARLSPYFLDAPYLLRATGLYAEAGIAALALTFVIVAGHIDLSVASNMALTGTLLGVFFGRMSLPLVACVLLALLASLLMGLLNGVLVARAGLPSLAVTLGTFALYRGIAQMLVGDGSISGFPEAFNGADQRYLAGVLPLPLAVFLILAAIHGLVLHRSYIGRWVYAIGTNPTAARYSGVPISGTLIGIFLLSGLMSGIGGILLTSRLTASRYDMAMGWELDAITAVVLGGTDIAGGRGTILGTAAAFFLMTLVRTGMGLADIKIEKQLVAIGVLLLVSVMLPNLLQRRRD
ncbi:MAG: ABC transporter permease [Armatimonadetes bacterium]|nr:ABC transporter permease [Armatimonadota bacterium]